MRAIDLRIGNILRDKISKTELKVIELTEKNIGAYVIDRSKFPLKEGWEFEPIPLTEEILLKCGFVKNEEHDEGGLIDFRYELNLLNKSISFTSNWNIEDCIYVNITQCGVDVFYLHQLQNLYFALTGEELTVNL